MAFQSFAPVSMAETPNLIAAQNADDRLDRELRRDKLSNYAQLAGGGIQLAQDAMNPDTVLGNWFGAGEEPSWTNDAISTTAIPEVASGAGESAAISNALRGGELSTFGVPELAGATSGLNTAATGAALAPELGTAALGVPELLGATSGFNEAGTLAAMAAPEVAAGTAAAGAGAAGAGSLMSILGPAGLALSLGSLLGLFG